MWAFFCGDEWLGLTRQQTEQWWRALQDATWSRPTALRHAVLARALLREKQGTMRDFLTTQLAPKTLIDTLEDLIREQRLPAREARQIEEAVLQKMHGSSGLWV